MIGLLPWIGVAVFGALGAYARFSVGAAVTGWRPSPFPFGTFVVNLTGGFVLGLLVGLSVTGDALFVLGTGFLGGYTTFSTWMVEGQRLGEDGDWRRATLYLGASLLGGAVTTAGGWLLGGAFG